jgi:hypothetical protein
MEIGFVMNGTLSALTVDEVRKAINEFSGWDDEPDPALTILFTQYPKNTNFDHVLLKVVALNTLYSTMIRVNSEITPTVYDVARHIVAHNIDTALEDGNVELVERIAAVTVGSKHQRNYSFATKYCNWHKQELFPIYDSRVDVCLWHLQKIGRIEKLCRQDIYYSYPEFKCVLTKFMDSFLPEKFTYKEIDQYLYVEGRKLFSAMKKMKQSTITVSS